MVAVFRWHLATVYVVTVGGLSPHKCLYKRIPA